MLKTARVHTVRDQIADQLRSDLISGKFKPGERLREEDMADRFGVSRGPIRDVLLQLTKEGLLISRRNAGVMVNELPSPALQKLMVDLRLRIELFAVQNVVGKLSEEDFVDLDEYLEALGTALKKEDFTRATEVDIAFHRFIVERAGGVDLVNTWIPIVMRMRMNYQRISTPEQSIKEHQAIVDALQKQDSKAASAALKANIR